MITGCLDTEKYLILHLPIKDIGKVSIISKCSHDIICRIIPLVHIKKCMESIHCFSTAASIKGYVDVLDWWKEYFELRPIVELDKYIFLSVDSTLMNTLMCWIGGRVVD